MATMRAVDTRFWSDVWVRKLNALDRYVFLYLLTNEHSSWCGVYELEINMMAFECGVEVEELKKAILPRLSPKIVYVDGWVFIKNFERYHANRSEKTKKGIENAWGEVPERIRLKIKKIMPDRVPNGYPIDGVSPSSSSSSSSSSYLRLQKASVGDGVFVLKDELEKMMHDEKHMRVISIFLREKRDRFGTVDFASKEQLDLAKKRYLRSAKEIANAIKSLDVLKSAMHKAFDKCGDETTLETVIKYLTK